MNYLLDTCVLSELVKPAPDPHVMRWMAARDSQSLHTSAVVWAELQRGVHRLAASARRDSLTQWLAQVATRFEDRILPFDDQAASYWATICVQSERMGRPMAAFDSMIAATAAAHGLAMVTRNTKDFEAAPLVLINPWSP